MAAARDFCTLLTDPSVKDAELSAAWQREFSTIQLSSLDKKLQAFFLIAAQWGNVTGFEWLVQKWKNDFAVDHVQLHYYIDAFVTAAGFGQLNMVSLIYDLAGKNILDKTTDHLPFHSQTALMAASAGGYLPVVQFLIGRQAATHLHNINTHELRTALCYAVHYERFAVVAYELPHMSEVTMRHCLAFCKKDSPTRRLVVNKLDPLAEKVAQKLNTIDEKETSDQTVETLTQKLNEATTAGHLEKATKLIQALSAAIEARLRDKAISELAVYKTVHGALLPLNVFREMQIKAVKPPSSGGAATVAADPKLTYS